MYCRRTYLVFWYLGQGVQGVDSEHIGGTLAEMERHEQPALFDIFSDFCQRGYLAAAGDYFDSVTIGNSEFAGIFDLYFDIAGG